MLECWGRAIGEKQSFDRSSSTSNWGSLSDESMKCRSNSDVGNWKASSPNSNHAGTQWEMICAAFKFHEDTSKLSALAFGIAEKWLKGLLDIEFHPLNTNSIH